MRLNLAILRIMFLVPVLFPTEFSKAYIDPGNQSAQTTQNEGFLDLSEFGVKVEEQLIRDVEAQQKSEIKRLESSFDAPTIGDVSFYTNSSALIKFNLETSNLEKVFGLEKQTSYCRKYVKQNILQYVRKIFQLDLLLSIRHNESATLSTNEYSNISFNVFANEILVEDNHIDCRYNQGKLVQVVAKILPLESIKDPLKLGEKFQGVNFTKKEKRYRIFSEKGKYHLLPVESFEVITGQNRRRIQVSLLSGLVFEVRDLTFYQSAFADEQLNSYSFEGLAYDRYYQDQKASRPFKNLKLIGENEKELFTDDFGVVYSNVQPVPAETIVSGRFVNTFAISGPLPSISLSPELNATYFLTDSDSKDNDLALAHLNVYYHTDAIINYSKQFIDSNWFNRSLKANVNIKRSCNAHWDGRTINFYVGDARCANTALIADVVYHEWGHGLDANTGGIQDGAFSEGFGDIMSVMMTGSPELGAGFKLDGSPVRNLEQDRIYPDDVVGQVHRDGLIIGSTFYDLYEGLIAEHGEKEGIRLFSNYSLKMIFAARTYNDVYDALLVIDDDDGNLNNGTPNLCLLNEIFEKHGLADVDSACIVAGEINLYNLDGQKIESVFPGDELEVRVGLTRQSPEAVKNVRVDLTFNGLEAQLSEVFFDSLEGQNLNLSSQTINLRVPESIECGSQLDIKARVIAEDYDLENSLITQIMTGVRASMKVEKDLGELNKPIPDFGEAVIELDFLDENLPEFTPFDLLEVEFSASHKYMGDLIFYLESPEGKRIKFFTGRYSDGKSVTRKVTDLARRFEADFGKVNFNGKWKLILKDVVRADSGVLNSFKIRVAPKIFVCKL